MSGEQSILTLTGHVYDPGSTSIALLSDTHSGDCVRLRHECTEVLTCDTAEARALARQTTLDRLHPAAVVLLLRTSRMEVVAMMLPALNHMHVAMQA